MRCIFEKSHHFWRPVLSWVYALKSHFCIASLNHTSKVISIFFHAIEIDFFIMFSGIFGNFFKDVVHGNVYEVSISDQYKQEMIRNEFSNAQLLYFNYTPADCDYVLSVILNALIQSTFGRVNANFHTRIEESAQHISEMANIFPMNFFLPKTFRHIMRTTMISTPELRLRMMSLLCQNNFYQKGSVWSLVKVWKLYIFFILFSIFCVL